MTIPLKSEILWIIVRLVLVTAVAPETGLRNDLGMSEFADRFRHGNKLHMSVVAPPETQKAIVFASIAPNNDAGSEGARSMTVRAGDIRPLPRPPSPAAHTLKNLSAV
jgi:hypothetical protein